MDIIINALIEQLEKRGYKTLAFLVFTVATVVGLGFWLFSVHFLG